MKKIPKKKALCSGNEKITMKSKILALIPNKPHYMGTVQGKCKQASLTVKPLFLTWSAPSQARLQYVPKGPEKGAPHRWLQLAAFPLS